MIKLNYKAIHKALRDSNPHMTYKCRRKVIDAMEIALFIKYQAPVLAGINIGVNDE